MMIVVDGGMFQVKRDRCSGGERGFDFRVSKIRGDGGEVFIHGWMAERVDVWGCIIMNRIGLTFELDIRYSSFYIGDAM